jgi:long-subunit acyl-CoA synthetase (AMP-forming)
MITVLQQLQQLAASSPDSSAVTGSDYTLSWSSLSLAIGSLADKLRPCHTVGLYLQNSPAWIVSDLAAASAEIRNTPLPTFFSDEQLQYAISDAHIDIIITDNPSRLSTLIEIIEQEMIDVCGTALSLIRLSTTKNPDTPACKITYTSGTTGTPRGVILQQRHIESVAQSLCAASQASDSDRALVMLPLSTLLENIGSVYTPILAGAQIIVPDAAETGLSGSSSIDIQAFATMLDKYRPTTMILPPQLLKLVVGLATQGQLPDSFRYIAVGGAPVGGTLLEQARALDLPIYQGYGLSEACSVVTVNTPDKQRIGSVGKPLPHSQVQISDAGEILVSGTIYDGYLNAPTPTGKTLATGDLGYMDDDGYLYITGRRKDVIITGYGRNVSPEWLEAQLQAHADIAQAAIYGNGRAFLTAVIVPSASMYHVHQGQLSEMLDSFTYTLESINAGLPDYARVTEFIIAEQPFSPNNNELTANGRPRREVIGQHYARQIADIYEEKNEQLL